MTPGPVSESSAGPFDHMPFVPSLCYPNGPKMCPCGHHEGFHGDDGRCLLESGCRCAGLPAECRTSDEEMLA